MQRVRWSYLDLFLNRFRWIQPVFSAKKFQQNILMVCNKNLDHLFKVLWQSNKQQKKLQFKVHKPVIGIFTIFFCI